jgi:hypothetical protein
VPKITEIIPANERCEFCGKRGILLCDFPMGNVVTSLDFKRVSITCDKRICHDCATHVAFDVDYCPNCMERVKTLKPGGFTQ